MTGHQPEPQLLKSPSCDGSHHYNNHNNHKPHDWQCPGRPCLLVPHPLNSSSTSQPIDNQLCIASNYPRISNSCYISLNNISNCSCLNSRHRLRSNSRKIRCRRRKDDSCNSQYPEDPLNSEITELDLLTPDLPAVDSYRVTPHTSAPHSNGPHNDAPHSLPLSSHTPRMSPGGSDHSRQDRSTISGNISTLLQHSISYSKQLLSSNLMGSSSLLAWLLTALLVITYLPNVTGKPKLNYCS